MSDKLLDIAKENGAIECTDHIDIPVEVAYVFTPDELLTTIEQVCAPLVEALKRAENLRLFDETYIDSQIFSKRTSLRGIKRNFDEYLTLIGDKE